MKLCLASLLLSGIPAVSCADSLDLNNASAQQLLTGNPTQHGYEAGAGFSGMVRESATPNTGSYRRVELDKEDNLFNPDGTLGVSKDTKMQINPNGVNFKLGY